MDPQHKNITRLASSGVSIGLIALALCAWVCAIEFTGVTSAANDLTYDAFATWNANRSDLPTSVITVYADRETLEDDPVRFHRLVDILQASGAKRIGITHPISELHTDLQEQAENGSAGRQLVFSSATDQKLRDGRNAAGPIVNQQLNFGAVELLDGQQVYRRHYTRRSSETFTRTSLEWMIAKNVLMPTDWMPDADFRINFRGGSGSLPHFDEQQVLRGDLVPEIVANKIVLIGKRPGSTTPGISIPVTQNAMPTLELHGHILHTLLSRSAILELPAFVRCTLFTLLTLIGYLLYQRLGARRMLPVCMAVIGLLLLTSWMLVSFCGVWLPVTSAIVGQFVACGFLLGRRLNFLNAATGQLTLKRKLQSTQSETPEVWDVISTQITELFLPVRFVLLELDTGATHSSIVNVTNCNESEIVERRRDSRREPYLAAVESGGPSNSQQRQFFEYDSGAKPVEVVIPFIFAGELLGFAVADFSGSELLQDREQLSQLSRFADSAAATIAAQRASRRQSRITIRQLLTSVPEEQTVLDIVRVEELAAHRLGLLEQFFERATGGLAVYGLFGQLAIMNSTLRSELQRRGLVASGVSLTEVIAELSGKQHNVSRNILRDVALGTTTRELHVPNDNGLDSLLYLHPITNSEHKTGQTDSILVEFVSSEPLAGTVELKDRVTTQLYGEVDDKIEQLFQLARDLTHEPIGGVHKIASLMKDDLVDLRRAMQQGNSYLTASGADPNCKLPVQVTQHLAGPLADQATVCGTRGIAINNQVALDLPDVIANPFLLEETFARIVELLVETSFNDAVILITSSLESGVVRLRFENHGHGTATESLREALQSDAKQTPDRLSDVEQWLGHWDGRMSVSSRIGDGLIVQLRLTQHQWATESSRTRRVAYGPDLSVSDDADRYSRPATGSGDP